MADDFGVYDITGQFQVRVSQSLETALEPPSGNLNVRRLPERTLYNRLLLGTAQKSEVAESPYDSTPATIPSWTQVEAEKKHAFVIGELSSSDHLVDVQNAYVSGVFPLENTAVPASGAFYYSKARRFVQKIYKLSASAGMAIIPGNERGPSTVENYARGTFDSVSGSYRNNSYWNPAVFEIDVPDYGKIRDVKIWVELVHDIRKGTGPIVSASAFGGTGDPNPNRRQGLQGLQIALRSPNTSFDYAHPLWNDDQVKENRKNPDPVLPERYRRVPDLLRNSYLLWAGHAVEQDLGQTLIALTSSLPDQFYDLRTFTTGFIGVANGWGREITAVCDGENRPHVAFTKFYGGAWHLMYAKLETNVNSFRTTKVFDGGGYPNDPGEWNKILVNKSNQPRIGHSALTGPGNQSTYRFSYSNDDGVTWTTETVALVSSFGPCDMALTTDDVPYMIYSTFDAVYVAKRVSPGNWKKERIFYCDSGFVDDSLGIVVDSQNRPEAIMGINAEAVLFHAKSGSDGWVTEPFPFPPSNYMQFVQMAIDSKDAIHVFGRYDTDNTFGACLTYFRSSSDGWYSSSFNGPEPHVVDGWGGGENTTIAINPVTDKPGMTWWRYSGIPAAPDPDQIRVAEIGENGFSQRVVDYSDGEPMPAIAYDSFGNQFVFYNTGSLGGGGGTGLAVWATTKNSLLNTGGGPRPQKGGISSSFYHSFNRDIDMRTIFTDSSRNLNPRHTKDLVVDGVVKFPTRKLITGGAYASPTSASLLNYFKYSNYPLVLDTDHFMTGVNFPWMLDNRIPPGNFFGRNYSFATGSDGNSYPTSSFPTPPGWLTGPGGTAATNEWPTKGMSLGPNDILPVYPLLDDVYVEKVFDQPSYSSVATISDFHPRIIGYRPGLRGTEVHGKWKLLIGNNADFDGSVGMTGSIRDGWWFRQFRLEFLIDQGEEIRGGSYPSKTQRFKKHAVVAGPAGRRLIEIVSGSAAWDIGVNHVFAVQPEEYGRSIGIVDVTGTADFAVFSQITGTFADILSGAGLLSQVQETYLFNEFGTPYIPVSSGSAEIPSFDAFDIEEFQKSRTIFNETLNPKTLIPRDNTLRAHLARADILKSTRDLILSKIEES